MNEFKSMYFQFELLTEFGKKEKNIIYILQITESAVCYSMNNFWGKNLGELKNKKQKKKGHAHKQTMMRLLEFLTFYYSFLLLTVFFLKEAVHQRAFCSYIVIFYRGKYCTTFFFSSQNNIWSNIIYTHYYSLYYDHLFPMPSSGDNSRSVCPLLSRTYSLNKNQRVV